MATPPQIQGLRPAWTLAEQGTLSRPLAGLGKSPQHEFSFLALCQWLWVSPSRLCLSFPISNTQSLGFLGWLRQ